MWEFSVLLNAPVSLKLVPNRSKGWRLLSQCLVFFVIYLASLTPPFCSFPLLTLPLSLVSPSIPLWANLPYKYPLCQQALLTKLSKEPLALPSIQCHFPSLGSHDQGHMTSPPCLTITWILFGGLLTSGSDTVSSIYIYLQLWLGISLRNAISGFESPTKNSCPELDCNLAPMPPLGA